MEMRLEGLSIRLEPSLGCGNGGNFPAVGVLLSSLAHFSILFQSRKDLSHFVQLTGCCRSTFGCSTYLKLRMSILLTAL